MKVINRRDFLKLSGIASLSAVSAAALASCSKEGGSTAETGNTAPAGTDNSTTAQAGAQPSVTEQTTGGNTTEKSEEIRQALSENIYFSTEFLRDQTIIANSGDGASFNPFGGGRWGSVRNVLFLPLVANNNRGDLKLVLLKSITEVDELTYDLEFWPNIHDTAGNPFTANDAAWSIDQFIANGNAGGVNRLDHTEVISDTVLRWHLKQKFGPGEMVKNLGNPPMVVQKSYEASGNDMMASSPEGTGPYKLASYTPGNKVVFEAVEDYWYREVYDDPANKEWVDENLCVEVFQNVKGYEWHILQDAAARATALEMGSVDACDSLNASDVKYFKENPSLNIQSVNLPVTPPIAFYFNASENSPCQNVELRKAICYAIDNASIAAGIGVPAYQVYGILPNQLDAPADWLSGREYYDYSVDKAKECLQKAGYNGERLVIMYMSSSAIDATLIMFDAQMNAAGINCDLYPVEQSVMNTEKYDFTKWDIIFETFGGGSYMSNVAKRWWAPDAERNLGGKINILGIEEPTLDALFVTLNDTNSEEAIVAWDQYFTYDQCYAYAICGYYNQTAAKNSVNVALSGTQNQLVAGAFTFND